MFAPFKIENLTYGIPEQRKYTRTMRIQPAPRGIQLGLDPKDQDKLPIVMYDAAFPLNAGGDQHQMVSCLIRLNDDDSPEFFQRWDEANIQAYVKYAKELAGRQPRWLPGTEEAWFRQNYRSIVQTAPDGGHQIRLNFEIDDDAQDGTSDEKRKRGTTIFKATPKADEPGSFRLKRGTWQSITSGSRLMARLGAWYLGLSDSGFPTCKLYVTEVTVFPGEPIQGASGTPSVFKLPDGISFELDDDDDDDK